MLADTDVLVIGAGQAGLAVSHELSHAGTDHLVVERSRIASTWAGRWDSFHLVSPNHGILLPGGEYRGDDPAGYLSRDEIVAHLTAYAASFAAPLMEDTEVESLGVDEAGFEARTPRGGIRARRVVVCTGAYQAEHRPAFAAELERRVPVVYASAYRSPGALPDGPVLVVGGGQSAVQIVEDLRIAGRDVSLAAGSSPAMPRRAGGRDVFDWLFDLGFFEMTLDDVPSPAVRLAPNPTVTGARGGHDLGLRTLAAGGVPIMGHVLGIDGDRLRIADDLAESVAVSDETWTQVCDLIRLAADQLDVPRPELADVPTAAIEPAAAPRIDDLGAVVVACGFRPAYGWIDVDGVVDGMGFPVQHDGASAVVPGLHFVGVPWLRNRRSPLLMGVGEDAAVVAAQLTA